MVVGGAWVVVVVAGGRVVVVVGCVVGGGEPGVVRTGGTETNALDGALKVADRWLPVADDVVR